MFQGFSRRTLSALIFICCVIIAWISVQPQQEKWQPLPVLDLALLTDEHWQRWQSQEGVDVRWRSIISDTIDVRIRYSEDIGSRDLSSPPISALATSQITRLSVNAEQWPAELANAFSLTQNKQQQSEDQQRKFPAQVTLQGPLNERIMMLFAAFVIDRLALAPMLEQTQLMCVMQTPAGAYGYLANGVFDQAYTADQASALSSSSDTPLAIPSFIAATPVWKEQHLRTKSGIAAAQAVTSRDQWQAFRQNAVKQLRQQWLNPQQNIDIQADLAYHNLPDDFYQLLYQDLGRSQWTAPRDYETCLAELYEAQTSSKATAFSHPESTPQTNHGALP
ncbi:MAG: hypothetical protein P1U57_13135 [Oleibacter sp.]|nr:hypothetical protein [Thalassolituus sp.]